MRRAFTIVELLIVVLIIALVVSLTLPSLGGLKWRAQELKSIANLRSHAALIATYAGDEREYFPFFTNPEAPVSIVRGGGLAVPISHFSSFWTWNVALADNYLGGNTLPDSFVVPWLGSHRPTFTFYYYGDCFVSRPDFWRHETRRVGSSQWRATTVAEVQFPSQKGLVREDGWGPGEQYPNGDRDRFNLVDGSARQFANEELRSPLPDGAGIGFGIQPPFGGVFPGLAAMHTVDGVYGRDVR